jgi:hypothetical protein
MLRSADAEARKRSLHAAIAALSRHARGGENPTAKARAAFMGRWLRQVDEVAPGLPGAECHRRAERLKTLYFKRIAFKRHHGKKCKCPTQ